MGSKARELRKGREDGTFAVCLTASLTYGAISQAREPLLKVIHMKDKEGEHNGNYHHLAHYSGCIRYSGFALGSRYQGWHRFSRMAETLASGGIALVLCPSPFDGWLT